MPDTRMNTKMKKTKACSYEAFLLSIRRHGLRVVQKTEHKHKREGGSLDEVMEIFLLGPIK